MDRKEKAERIMKKGNDVYKLRACVWELTLKCCFSCQYCGSNAGNERKNELSTEECIDIVDQLAGLGCRRVSLIGGEVFMREDWAQIAERLTAHGIRVSIVSNGYLLREQQACILKEIGIESVGISLDGPVRIHGAYRRNGSFESADRAISLLVGKGIPVSVITTLHSENIRHLDELYDFLHDKKIFAWQLQACVPMGKTVKAGINWKFDFNEAIHFVEQHAFGAPFLLGIADNIGYYTESEGYLRGNLSGGAIFSGCRAGLTSVGIDSVGNVRGCEAMQDDCFIEGNLREQRLGDIWNREDAFSYNRKFHTDMLKGNCASCSHGSKCAGGCRAYNYFATGNLYQNIMCAKK